MAHFAKLNSVGVITNVLVVDNNVLLDDDGIEQEKLGIDYLSKLFSGGWYKQTSYNGNFRGIFAGIGYKYDTVDDRFIPPKPFDSWILGSNGFWQPPTPRPNDNKNYEWDKATTSWVEQEV
jgi:hypothetical protein